MTKAGAGGAKSRARKTQQATGVKYTTLRSTAAARARRGRVVQFLTDGYEVATLPYQIAAAWTRHGLHVLLLHDYKPYRTDRDLYSNQANAERPKRAARRIPALEAPCSCTPTSCRAVACSWNSTPRGTCASRVTTEAGSFSFVRCLRSAGLTSTSWS